jgi:hypothetical protein
MFRLITLTVYQAIVQYIAIYSTPTLADSGLTLFFTLKVGRGHRRQRIFSRRARQRALRHASAFGLGVSQTPVERAYEPRLHSHEERHFAAHLRHVRRRLEDPLHRGLSHGGGYGRRGRRYAGTRARRVLLPGFFPTRHHSPQTAGRAIHAPEVRRGLGAVQNESRQGLGAGGVLNVVLVEELVRKDETTRKTWLASLVRDHITEMKKESKDIIHLTSSTRHPRLRFFGQAHSA